MIVTQRYWWLVGDDGQTMLVACQWWSMVAGDRATEVVVGPMVVMGYFIIIYKQKNLKKLENSRTHAKTRGNKHSRDALVGPTRRTKITSINSLVQWRSFFSICSNPRQRSPWSKVRISPETIDGSILDEEAQRERRRRRWIGEAGGLRDRGVTEAGGGGAQWRCSSSGGVIGWSDGRRELRRRRLAPAPETRGDAPWGGLRWGPDRVRGASHRCFPSLPRLSLRQSRSSSEAPGMMILLLDSSSDPGFPSMFPWFFRVWIWIRDLDGGFPFPHKIHSFCFKLLPFLKKI